MKKRKKAKPSMAQPQTPLSTSSAPVPSPQDDLVRFTLAAKAIIYNRERMLQFLKLMDTPQGAVTAVHTVITAIEQQKPIPPQIAILLAINIYVIMVDMAQQITGRKASPQKMHMVMNMIAQGLATQQSDQQPPQMAPAPQPAPVQGAQMPQGGIINSAMQGASA